MASRKVIVRGRIYEESDARKVTVGPTIYEEDSADAPAGGRIMSSIAGAGGLAGKGGIAGPGGGLAG